MLACIRYIMRRYLLCPNLKNKWTWDLRRLHHKLNKYHKQKNKKYRPILNSNCAIRLELKDYTTLIVNGPHTTCNTNTMISKSNVYWHKLTPLWNCLGKNDWTFLSSTTWRLGKTYQGWYITMYMWQNHKKSNRESNSIIIYNKT